MVEFQALIGDLVRAVHQTLLSLTPWLLLLAVLLGGWRVHRLSSDTARRGAQARFRRALELLEYRFERYKFAMAVDSPLRKEIEALLQELRALPLGDRDWEGVYRLERRLTEALIETGDAEELQIEFRRALQQAEALKIPELPVHYEAAKDPSPNDLRSLIADVQWGRGERYAQSKLAAVYVSRAGFLVLAMGSLCALYLVEWRPIQDGGYYAGLDFAAAAGAFGASFFALAHSRRQLPNADYQSLSRAVEWPVLLFRIVFGAGAAVALYFAFSAELIDGILTPNMQLVQFANVSNAENAFVPNVDLGLLFFWSFLSGYSEKLVVNLLERKEADFHTGDRRGPPAPR